MLHIDLFSNVITKVVSVSVFYAGSDYKFPFGSPISLTYILLWLKKKNNIAGRHCKGRNVVSKCSIGYELKF
jgi:hypothetical protein